MNNELLFDLECCPHCRGDGLVYFEGNTWVYVECQDCGAQTTFLEYNNEQEKKEAAHNVVNLWNLGKVIRIERGE